MHWNYCHQAEQDCTLHWNCQPGAQTTSAQTEGGAGGAGDGHGGGGQRACRRQRRGCRRGLCGGGTMAARLHIEMAPVVIALAEWAWEKWLIPTEAAFHMIAICAATRDAPACATRVPREWRRGGHLELAQTGAITCLLTLIAGEVLLRPTEAALQVLAVCVATWDAAEDRAGLVPSVGHLGNHVKRARVAGGGAGNQDTRRHKAGEDHHELGCLKKQACAMPNAQGGRQGPK